MVRSWMFQHVLFLYFGTFGSSSEISTRTMKAIINADFLNKQIKELPMKIGVVRSELYCIGQCAQTSLCLSVAFNDNSKKCFLFDKDFVNVTETQTIDEVGWNYYYVMPGTKHVSDRTKCELPTNTIKVCFSFCFFYKNGFSSNTVQDFTQACKNDGGEVVTVDRYLKQYCIEQTIGNFIGGDVMTLGGVQNETTGKWTYFDGTKMTYAYWDDAYAQPSYISPSETPGIYEGILATIKFFKYRWHDYPESWVNGVVCEIK